MFKNKQIVVLGKTGIQDINEIWMPPSGGRIE